MKEKITKSKMSSLLKQVKNVDGEFEIINNKLIVELTGDIIEEKEKDDILTKILNSIDEIKGDVKSVKNDVKLLNNKFDSLNDKLNDVIETNNLKLSREHKQWSFKNDDNPDNKNNPTR